MADDTSSPRRVVVVGGCRTPFCRSGTAYTDLNAYDLGRAAVSGLMHRSGIDPDLVDLLVMGTVIADPSTSNLGREVVLGTRLPRACVAYTVTMACVSSLQAFVDCTRAIADGSAEVAIAAGAETLSDAPIRYRQPIRKRLIASQKARGVADYLKLLKGLRLADLSPEPVAIAERSTGETMGQSCERLAKRLGIDRRSQDEYALMSHQRAAAAARAGHLDQQIVATTVPPDCVTVRSDNGVRGDSTIDKLASLRPAFDRRLGTVTAGSSSYLTDGAAAVLLMSETMAEHLGLEPLAVVRANVAAAMDPREDLLLGPAKTIPRALEAAGLGLDEIGTIELHEAFAAQVLAVLAVLENDELSREVLGRDQALGSIDRQRLNAWGGSLSIGHPFGATGARLITSCCHRMTSEHSRYGLIAACAAGGLGIGTVLERP